MKRRFFILIVSSILICQYSYSQTHLAKNADTLATQENNHLKDHQDPISIHKERNHFEDSRKTEKIGLKFLGYVKLIAGIDWGNIQNTSEFYPSKIPIYPTEREKKPRSFLDARQSRLALDGNYRVKNHKGLHIYIEIDFYNTEAETSLVPHLRHAYGEYNGFLLGQTWSTMKNTSAYPIQVDFEGPNSIPGPRNPMIRYTKAFNKGYTMAIALETHSEDYTPFPTYSNDVMTFQYLPDFIAYIQKSGKWGNIRINGILRNISYTEEASERIQTVNGWGVELSGIIKFAHRKAIFDDIRYGLTYGSGISYYINDLRGMGLSAAPNTENKMTAIPVMGFYIAYKHAWNKRASSSAIFSYTSINNSEFMDDKLYDNSSYGAINYMWSPLDRLDFGLELIYGKNINKIQDYGLGYRAQGMAIYHF